jgi:hypothetical protein
LGTDAVAVGTVPGAVATDVVAGAAADVVAGGGADVVAGAAADVVAGGGADVVAGAAADAPPEADDAGAGLTAVLFDAADVAP